MTAIVIGLRVRLDHPGPVGRRDRRRRGADQRRIDRRVRADRRDRRRRVRRADRSLWRPAARRGRRRAAGRTARRTAGDRPPANPVAAARAGARRDHASTMSSSAIRPGSKCRAARFLARRRAGRDGRGGRAVGRGQDDAVPADPALLRSRRRRAAPRRRRPARGRPRRDPRAASRWCRRKR